MSTKTIVQSLRAGGVCRTTATTTATAAVATPTLQRLSSISLMLEYDIDNTLNTIKESGSHIMKKATVAEEAPSPSLPSPSSPSPSSPSPSPSSTTQTNARKRWRILAKVLRKDSEDAAVSSSGEDEERSASVRRFKSFDVLRQDSFEDHMSLDCLGRPENWYKYRVLLEAGGQREYTVNIHHVERHLTASDLMGFNNTGNVCVWPSEEALTAYVLSDLVAYRGKWVLELGGGFTCLAGLMLSKYARPYAVHLTDGNQVSVANVKRSVCLNELSCYTKCSVLKWEEAAARPPAEAAKFDVILSADCLFFDEARSALVDTMWFYLAPLGVALVMAPRRGKTMSLFVADCRCRGFGVAIEERYNAAIWKRHLELKHSDLYDEDLHYPILIVLTKTMATDADVDTGDTFVTN